jgi:hypothetical protein
LQVIGSCTSCHDNSIADGMPPDHLPTTAECDDCHTTSGWLPATFDHGGVLPGSCTTCHDGNIADGKDIGHVSTSEECDLCHSTVSWIPANFNHDGVTGSCSNCHDGATATGMDGSHFVTSRQCDYCHDTNFWTPLIFSHLSAGYPGDHRTNLICEDCHGGNTELATWPAPQYQPDCAACHATDFKPSAHKKFENPDSFYNLSELRDCTGACHQYTDSSLSTIKDMRPGPEHRVGDNEF